MTERCEGVEVVTEWCEGVEVVTAGSVECEGVGVVTLWRLMWQQVQTV